MSDSGRARAGFGLQNEALYNSASTKTHPNGCNCYGSQFACLLLFQTVKNRTQRNRCMKGCEILNQNRHQKVFYKGLYICAWELDILKVS